MKEGILIICLLITLGACSQKDNCIYNYGLKDFEPKENGFRIVTNGIDSFLVHNNTLKSVLGNDKDSHVDSGKIISDIQKQQLEIEGLNREFFLYKKIFSKEELESFRLKLKDSHYKFSNRDLRQDLRTYKSTGQILKYLQDYEQGYIDIGDACACYQLYPNRLE